jgi:uronate dehydrogenase
MTVPKTVLLTGAAGGVGTLMRERLPRYGYELRLFDVAPIEDAPDAITADLLDETALREAVRGVDAVVHLAGISVEAPFDDIVEANIRGTHRLYEAVRAEGVRRVVFASSNHVVGFVPRDAADDAPLPVDIRSRPDTYYGVSKVFGEGLASLYADKYGVETVSVRIGSCFPTPANVRMLSTWLSPDDCARLLHAAITAPDVGHTIVYGLSANTRGWWDLGPARALGYEPQDDSEVYAEKLIAEQGEPDPDSVDMRLLGGRFTVMEP